jgi:hypothetical protein
MRNDLSPYEESLFTLSEACVLLDWQRVDFSISIPQVFEELNPPVNICEVGWWHIRTPGVNEAFVIVGSTLQSGIYLGDS